MLLFRGDVEKLKASIRAKVEHPLRAVKQQFGYAKMRYRGLAKNTARLTMLFALSNLWMLCRQLIEAQGRVRPKGANAAQKRCKTPSLGVNLT